MGQGRESQGSPVATSSSSANFLVFDVMLHFVSPHRAEGASPHFPRRGESQNAVTEGILQPHVGPCSYIPSPACESNRYIRTLDVCSE
jgi:hypothetical protein